MAHAQTKCQSVGWWDSVVDLSVNRSVLVLIKRANCLKIMQTCRLVWFQASGAATTKGRCVGSQDSGVDVSCRWRGRLELQNADRGGARPLNTSRQSLISMRLGTGSRYNYLDGRGRCFQCWVFLILTACSRSSWQNDGCCSNRSSKQRNCWLLSLQLQLAIIILHL